MMSSVDQSQDHGISSTDLPTLDADYDVIDILIDGTYCSVRWDDLWSYYRHHVHYPLILFICIAGCVTNAMNLLIFTRSKMQSPTNLLLTVLAVTDFFCVFRKAVSVSLPFYRQGVDQRTSYQMRAEEWINEICFYRPSQNFADALIDTFSYLQLFHTWSIYMTVAVALWRVVAIYRPMQFWYWFSYKSAASVAAAFIGFATLLVPLLFVGTSLEMYDSRAPYDNYDNQCNDSTMTSDYDLLSKEQQFVGDDCNYVDPDYVLTQTEFGSRLQFWIHGLLIKLVPCFILMVSTILLIIWMKAASNNRLVLSTGRNMKIASAGPSNSSTEQTKNNRSHGDFNADIVEHKETRSERTDTESLTTTEWMRTTKMLKVLLIVFLVTEFPPGILAFFAGLIDSKKFFMQCYRPIRSFLNLNEYISSSVGFFIYLYMSPKFRQTFRQLFRIASVRSRQQVNSNSTLLPEMSLVDRL